MTETYEPDPADLCDLCIYPAVVDVKVMVPWLDFDAGDLIQACQPCASWMTRRRIAGHQSALPGKALHFVRLGNA